MSFISTVTKAFAFTTFATFLFEKPLLERKATAPWQWGGIPGWWNAGGKRNAAEKKAAAEPHVFFFFRRLKSNCVKKRYPQKTMLERWGTLWDDATLSPSERKVNQQIPISEPSRMRLGFWCYDVLCAFFLCFQAIFNIRVFLKVTFLQNFGKI